MILTSKCIRPNCWVGPVVITMESDIPRIPDERCKSHFRNSHQKFWTIFLAVSDFGYNDPLLLLFF